MDVLPGVGSVKFMQSESSGRPILCHGAKSSSLFSAPVLQVFIRHGLTPGKTVTLARKPGPTTSALSAAQAEMLLEYVASPVTTEHTFNYTRGPPTIALCTEDPGHSQQNTWNYLASADERDAVGAVRLVIGAQASCPLAH